MTCSNASILVPAVCGCTVARVWVEAAPEVAVVVHRVPFVVFREQVLDFPVVLPLANGEFEVLLRDGVPILCNVLAVCFLRRKSVF